MHVIAQVALCLPTAGAAVLAAWAWWGITNPAPIEFVPPVNGPRQLCQQPCGDLPELGGLSQSNHARVFTSASER